jgi:hypothetical protein
MVYNGDNERECLFGRHIDPGDEANLPESRARVRGKWVKEMDLQKIEEELKKAVASLDKGTRLETVLVEEDEYRVVLSRGTLSDRASLSKELLEEFLETGKRGHEVKKVLGKVISKLTLLAQRRG